MKIIGLTSKEVAERYKQGFVNTLPINATKTHLQIIAQNLFSVFNIIIAGMVVFLYYLYAKTSDSRLFMDSIGVMLVAAVNTLLAVIQEIRAKRAIEKVNLLLQRRVTVIRDGMEVEIERETVVKDEVIKLKRGDQIVADGRILESNMIELDEASLTGESAHQTKDKGDQTFSGTFCVSGHGYYRAEKVGGDCHLFNIIKMAKRFRFNISPLQKKIDAIIKVLFALAIVLVCVEVYIGPAMHTTRIDHIRKMVSIIIALIPQGLVLMVSITFALGVYRISKIGAVIEKLNSIESFSNVKVLCMDKTGTLTENCLSLNEVVFLDPSCEFKKIQTIIGVYAQSSQDKNETIQALLGIEAEMSAIVEEELPFSSERKYSALRLTIPDLSIEKKCYVLGAYEILLKSSSGTMSKATVDELLVKKNLFESRNLLFGEVLTNTPLSELQTGLLEQKITPIAVISLSDRVRLDASDTLAQLNSEGIEVKILSGDNVSSIKSIVGQLGWSISDSQHISGVELQNIDDAELRELAMKKKIFYRLQPEHKSRIIEALKEQKYFTAMIGDGVNDIPALKESDVAVVYWM